MRGKIKFNRRQTAARQPGHINDVQLLLSSYRTPIIPSSRVNGTAAGLMPSAFTDISLSTPMTTDRVIMRTPPAADSVSIRDYI